MGSYWLTFDEVSFDVSYIDKINNQIIIELPDQMEVITTNYSYYHITNAKVHDDRKEAFEQEIKSSCYWEPKLSSKIKGLLPLNIQHELVLFDYFLLYNITTGQYNVFPENGEYKIIFIAYDVEMHRIMVIDEYEICVD